MIMMFEIAGGWWFAADPDNTHTDLFDSDRTVGVLFDTVENTVQPGAHVFTDASSSLFTKVQALAKHFGSDVKTVYRWDRVRGSDYSAWVLFLVARG